MAQSGFDVLVLNDFGGRDANVVRDYLYCFNQHSRHNFFYLHKWSRNNFRRLQNFDFSRFDAIILFWDYFWIGSMDPMSYCYVPEWVANRIAEAPALKIQFLQDEYREVRLANQAMKRLGVNLMFSCVAKKDQELFYPKSLIPSLIATYPVLTGYVPSYLEKIHYPAAIDRPIDIGYRSRKLLYHLGALGQEKFQIAERFQDIADRFGFTANISVREEDRIYGEDWLSFMKACRFSLGTESGASVVDFDGQIRKRCQQYLAHHPQATFEEVSKQVFGPVDGKVVVQTISPRIFEASAFENTLVLHEGDYEGMIRPDEHYISVKKDYSNVAEVVERMKDRPFCEKLARNAKEVLIDSKRYNYRSFVKQFDAILETHLANKAPSRRPSRTLFYLMNYLNNDRIVPQGGVCLTIPHTCDVVYHYNRWAPYVTVLWYSICLLFDLVAQSPRQITALLVKALQKARAQGLSLGGMIKDLRIAALFLQMRGGVFARHVPPFDLRLQFQSETDKLIAQSVPRAPAGNGPPPAQADENEAVDRLLAARHAVSLQWDHANFGNALPLTMGKSNDDSIFLNADCVYRFESVNRLRLALTEEEIAVVRRLLLGGWRNPSWFGRIAAAWTLGLSAAKLAFYHAPRRVLQAVTARLKARRLREPAARTKQTMDVGS